MPRGTRHASDIFQRVLEEAAEELALSSRAAGSFEHLGIRGDERAGSLAQFLRNHLPGDFDVQKGEAIDYSDARTGQLDLVIFDKAGSAPVYVGEENLLLPCESLYVVIEVKSTLTQDELNKAYRSSLKLRRLRPFKSRFVGSRADGAPAEDKLHRCMYVIFAYESNLGATDWLSKEFARVEVAANGAGADLDTVDRVIVLDRGMIHPGNTTGKAIMRDDKSIFLNFYLHLVNFVSRERTRRPPVDWQIYSAPTDPGWKKLR